MKRIYFYGVFALIVILAAAVVFWHLHPATNITSANVASEAQKQTNSEIYAPSKTSLAGKAVASPSRAATNTNDRLAQMGITPEMTETQKMQKYEEWYIREAAKITAEHQHPIEFYGETVEGSNQPVAGVNAHLILTESPATPNGIVETNLQSDAQGYFSFTGAVGKLLQVWLNKEGYYVSKSNRIDFDYNGYQPNPNQPEVFHLRKKGPGADLVTSQYGIAKDWGFSTPLDGAPVWVDFLNRKTGNEGQMEISAVKPDRLKQERANEWSFRMSISDGGFIEENDEFPFEAPDSGYQPTVEFHFKIGEPGWTDTIHESYYIAFGQPRKYGRLDLDTQMYWGVRLTYAINPDGSRYLEPKSSNP
jgi:hypothetical protein